MSEHPFTDWLAFNFRYIVGCTMLTFAVIVLGLMMIQATIEGLGCPCPCQAQERKEEAL